MRCEAFFHSSHKKTPQQNNPIYFSKFYRLWQFLNFIKKHGGFCYNKDIYPIKENVMLLAISEGVIVKLGLYGLLPIFIGFLFFIIWDISKKSKAGKAGTFWLFVALGTGCFGFIAKGLIDLIIKMFV